MKGDVLEFIKVFSDATGVHPHICKGIYAVARMDKKMIFDSIGDLCTELNMSVEIGRSVAEVALNKYNPDKNGINKVGGSVVFSIKKLVRAAFPQFPSEIVDNIFQIVSEGDPSAMFDLLDDLKIPSSIFKLCYAVLTNKVGDVEDII
jgi:hypothetical protein